MDWEVRLITLYLKISEYYRTDIYVCCERFSNGGYKRCTDEEILTVYLFGILSNFKNAKVIHKYALSHLKHYFPGLPGYSGFIHRVNRMSEAFKVLSNSIQSERTKTEEEELFLVDSFPIALTKGQHAYTARVAKEVASTGYNATKKMYFYGVKAHVVARRQEGTLPEIEQLFIDEASKHDGPVFDQFRPMLHDCTVVADKAYKRPDEHIIEQKQNLKVMTPPMKAKGQELTKEQAKIAKALAKIRQPIETLFGWIQRKTSIQDASLVRSVCGLTTHVFSKLSAVLLAKSEPCFDF